MTSRCIATSPPLHKGHPCVQYNLCERYPGSFAKGMGISIFRNV